MINKLTKIEISGFKSIESLSIEPRDINVMIGPNGSGKSNFVSFFRMMSWMLSDPPRLQEFIGLNGAAHSLLHDGPKVTHDIEASLSLSTEAGINDYRFRLAHAARDILIFTNESFRFSGKNKTTPNKWYDLGVGHKETQMVASTDINKKTRPTITQLLRGLVVYQFHDTSFNSRIRQKQKVSEGRWLKEDAGNLSSFLYRMRENAPANFAKATEITSLIMPFFDHFVLEKENDFILLKWRERNCEETFDAGQASDGMLRTIALIALLCQPKENLPDVLFIDEPELGLHPYAISVIAGLIKSISLSRQVFIATQSPLFINQFDPEDIIVLDRVGRNSKFTQLNSKSLEDWLREYSLADLWEKNVIGGRP